MHARYVDREMRRQIVGAARPGGLQRARKKRQRRGCDACGAGAQQIDDEVKRIISDAYRTAKELIDTNRDKLEMIANALLEYETLDGSQVEDIVRKGSFTPPTKPTDAGPMMGAPAA